MKADATATERKRRSYWLRTLHQWHWISAAISMVGLLLFALTGITLNHAAQIPATPKVQSFKRELPADLRQQLATGQGPLPSAVSGWLDTQWSLHTADRAAEWSEDEIYLSLPRPGGDSWLSIDRASGEVEYERTDRGWIAWLNDLHKGRNAGTVWSWFIDLFAVACLVFTITGLFLLQLHSARRAMTWPLVGLGLVIPMLLALLFIH